MIQPKVVSVLTIEHFSVIEKWEICLEGNNNQERFVRFLRLKYIKGNDANRDWWSIGYNVVMSKAFSFGMRTSIFQVCVDWWTRSPSNHHRFVQHKLYLVGWNNKCQISILNVKLAMKPYATIVTHVFLFNSVTSSSKSLNY